MLTVLAMMGAGTAISAEQIVSTSDVELIFSMRKAEWEAYAPRVADPTWKIRLRKLDTGAGLMAFHPTNGAGLSVQPLFLDAKSPPTMLVIGSFYPVGMLRDLREHERELEAKAKKDLGKKYDVTARYVKPSPSLEGFELTVMPLK